MPTKKRLTNCSEIARRDSLGGMGEEMPNRRRRCRGPLSRHGRATATGYVKSCPVSDQEAVRQWASLHDCCQVCGIDEHKARWAGIT